MKFFTSDKIKKEKKDFDVIFYISGASTGVSIVSIVPS